MKQFVVPKVRKFEHQTPNMDPVAHAEYYDRLEVGLTDEVRKSYEWLETILVHQYQALIAAGLNIEWVSGEPYPSSLAMRLDVGYKHNLRVRRTVGDDYEDIPDFRHPMNHLVNIDNYRSGNWLRLNDIFRAVHDVYGHYASRSSFGPDGEAIAWMAHRATMPECALIALWCETRGQNAWTNHFGDHNERAMLDRPFAAQKYGFVNSNLK